MNFSAERTLSPVMPSLVAQLADLVRLQAGVGVERFHEDQLRRLRGDLFDVHAAFARDHQHRQAAAARSTTMPRYSSRAMSQPASTRTRRTVFPSGPVWIVTSSLPSKEPADCGGFLAALDELDAALLELSLIVPLPRPPAWIWAFTTASLPPSWSKAAAASSGGGGDDAGRHGDPRLAEELLALIFVNFHPVYSAVEKIRFEPRRTRRTQSKIQWGRPEKLVLCA